MKDSAPHRSVCWRPLWNQARPGLGLEHLLLAPCSAASLLLGFGEDGRPFTLRYRLGWDEGFNLRTADLSVESEAGHRVLQLRTDGAGQWSEGPHTPRRDLQGCRDIDIWPTPFTNSFPFWRAPLAIGERREFRVAWVSAPDLSVEPQLQAYTRTAARQYLFENCGSGFRARLTVDAGGLVTDYPGYFERVP